MAGQELRSEGREECLTYLRKVWAGPDPVIVIPGGSAKNVALFDKLRAALLKVLEEFPEAALDKPAPEHSASICPTLSEPFNLIASHPMMHAGQFAVVRRQLGKPILIWCVIS